MKSEIRGLPSGDFFSKDESILLRIKKTDNGVIIEFADFDADTYYSATIDENRKCKFEWGNVEPNENNEKGVIDGKD